VDGSFTVDLTTVSDFERTTRDIGGRSRPVLVVRHMQDGTAITTEAALASSRKMSILGRYLRREYSALMELLSTVELTTGSSGPATTARRSPRPGRSSRADISKT